MGSTLLVTNDFPPKLGGIQSYLWELWQRLDPGSTSVLTARSHPDHARFDEEQAARGLRISRVRAPILYFPSPFALRRIRETCSLCRPDVVLLDPVWPAGQPYSATVETNGRPAFRVMVPEYYAESCLACHGSPKGQMDITGYPKEGGKLNDLGAVISITLYH